METRRLVRKTSGGASFSEKPQLSGLEGQLPRLEAHAASLSNSLTGWR